MIGDRVRRILQKVFRIRQGEMEKTLLMAVYAFNAVAAFIIGRIMKDTLFLNQSQLSWLPYMYIIVAAAVSSVTLLYTRQIARFTLRAIINTTLIAIIAIFLLFRYFLYLPPQNWVVPALYIFVEVMGILLVIQFWTFANELFNSREAKRLFGVIGGGAVLANLYSFPIRSLKEYIGIPNLIYVCVLSICICLLIFNYLSRKYHLAITVKRRIRLPEDEHPQINGPSRRQVVFGSLQKHIFSLTMITILVVTFIDYQFKVTARHAFNGSELADFFFAVYAYGGLLACLTQFFLTSRILDKFGMLAALLVLPVLLFSGSIFTLGIIGYIGITIAKGSELVTRYTITDTTTQLLYQPLPPTRRRHSKAFSDGVIRPLAQAIAGTTFLVLNILLAIDQPDRIHQLSWAILVLIMVWVGLLVSTRQKYVEALLTASDRRAGQHRYAPEDDEAAGHLSRTAVKKALASNDESQILNAFEVLHLTRRHNWGDAIRPLLESDSPRIREQAVQFLGKSGNRKHSSAIRKRFADSDIGVRSMAIRHFCALEQERAVPQIAGFLSDPHPKVKAATISGLIQFGGLDGMLSSTVELKKMLVDEDPDVRRSGADVLGFIRIHSFYHPLFSLINDSDLKVRLAAIDAVGRMGSTELIPTLIHKLLDERTHIHAKQALSSFGEAVLPYLDDLLTIRYGATRLRLHIPTILADIPTQRSLEMLEGLMDEPSYRLRSSAISALRKQTLKLPEEVEPNLYILRQTLHSELQFYFQLLVNKQTVDRAGDGSQLLSSAMTDRSEETLGNVFTLLGMLYPREQIEIVWYNLKSDNPGMRANAIEIIDNICESESKRYLLPILDTIPLHEKAEAGQRLFKLNEPDIISLIRQILADDQDDWLAACAIHMAGACGYRELLDDLAAFIDHDDPILRESLLFSLNRLLDSDEKAGVFGKFESEKDEQVRLYLDSLQTA